MSGTFRDAPENGAGATCPVCGGRDTTLQQKRGSALCRTLYVCHDCREPFEVFA